MMSWCDGLEEARLLIAPDSRTSDEGQGRTSDVNCGRLLSLCHPKTGTPTCYVLEGDALQELHWFKQSYGSWFLGDYVCQDGSLYISTPVDPIFIFLPIFEAARMKKGEDNGKFRKLDEILYVNGYPDYRSLMSIAEKCMQLVCEVKEVGSSKFFRLDDSRVIAWLCQKVNNLQSDLEIFDKNYTFQDESERLRDVVSLLGEYLKKPCLSLLCNHLQLDIEEILVKISQTETLAVPAEDSPLTSSSMQGKAGVKSTTNGKQSKKMKTETSSQNIKDMFSRASRKGRK